MLDCAAAPGHGSAGVQHGVYLRGRPACLRPHGLQPGATTTHTAGKHDRWGAGDGGEGRFGYRVYGLGFRFVGFGLVVVS